MDCKKLVEILNNKNLSFKNFDILNFITIIFENKQLFDSRFTFYVDKMETLFNSNKESLKSSLQKYQKMLDNFTNPIGNYFNTDDYLTKYGHLCKKKKKMD